MTPGKFIKLIFALIAAIPLLNFCLALIYEDTARWVRLAAFGLPFFLSLWKPKVGFLAVVASLCWFEIPILRAELPNMFLSDLTLLGSLTALLICFRRTVFAAESGLSGRHFLYLPLLFVSVHIGASFLVSLNELWAFSYDGLSKKQLLSMFGRKLWVWDMRDNPIHSLSVANGYLIQLLLIQVLTRLWRPLNIKASDLMWAVLLGSLPVFAMALSQWQGWMSWIYSVGPAGTFQNENHLSYFSGMILLISLVAGFLAFREGSLKKGFATIPIAAVSAFCLLLGRGRTAWFSLLVSILFIGVVMLVMQARTLWVDKTSLRSLLPRIFASVGIACLVLWGFFIKLGIPEEGVITELLELFNAPSMEKLIFAGGRYHMMTEAWKAAFENPLWGIGLGHFFAKSNTQFEIHNQLLSWVVELGWLVIPFAIVPILVNAGELVRALVIRKSWRESFQGLAFLGLSIYIFLCTIMDIYFSYRSLLALSTVVLLLPLLSQDVRRMSSWWKPVFIVSGLFLGLMSVLSPHTRPILDQAWAVEQDVGALSGNRRWSGPVRHFDLAPNDCRLIEILPLFPYGESKLSYALTSSELLPSNYANLSTTKHFFAERQAGTLTLTNNRWHRLCFCRTNDKNLQKTILSIMVNKGSYLSLETHFGLDDRFISFGFSEGRVFPQTTETERQLCEQLREL